MSYFSQIDFGRELKDAFGRLKVANPYTIIDLKQLRQSSLFYDSAEVSGSATTSVYNQFRASTTLGVANLTAGHRVFQSKVRGVYQPGKALAITQTAVLGAHTVGVTKRVGYFDNHNGVFFQKQGADLSVGIRSSASGVAVDTIVPRASWSIDKLDGSGPSKITLDTTKSQIFSFGLEWLGVGSVFFAFFINGALIPFHVQHHANVTTGVYMSNPNLPIRYEIINDGTGAASELETICASVVSEGGSDDVSVSTYISRGGVPVTLGPEDALTPIVSVRLAAGEFATKVNPIQVDTFLTTPANIEWALILNPTIAGTDNAVWTPVTDSSLEYDITRDNTNIVTGGYKIGGGYGGSTNQNRAPVSGGLRTFLTLGWDIAENSDQLVLAVRNLDSAGGTAYGGITVGEYV